MTFKRSFQPKPFYDSVTKSEDNDMYSSLKRCYILRKNVSHTSFHRKFFSSHRKVLFNFSVG